MTEPSRELRKLADDLKQDALDQEPETEIEQGLVEGISRAAAKAEERAKRLTHLGGGAG